MVSVSITYPQTVDSPIDTELKKVCDEYKIAVKKSMTPKTLKSVSSARGIVKSEGAEALKWVFSVIVQSNWEDFKESFSGDWIEGLYYVYQKNKDNLYETKKNLENTFKNSNPAQVVSFGNITNPTLGRRTRLKVVLDKIAKGECNNEDMNLAFTG